MPFFNLLSFNSSKAEELTLEETFEKSMDFELEFEN